MEPTQKPSEMEWYMSSENHDGEGKKIFGGNSQK